MADTGWQELELENCEAAGENDLCQIRKIDKQVYIRGVLRTSASIPANTRMIAAKLPEGFRPSMRLQTQAGVISSDYALSVLIYIAKNGETLDLRNLAASALASGRQITIACTYAVD